jgi:hypothetical protein
MILGLKKISKQLLVIKKRKTYVKTLKIMFLSNFPNSQKKKEKKRIEIFEKIMSAYIFQIDKKI